jgi:hypothetical protein
MITPYVEQMLGERLRIMESFLIDEKKLDPNLRFPAVVQEYVYSDVYKFDDLGLREQLHVCGVFLRSLDDLERDDFVLDIGQDDLGECIARYMTRIAVLPLDPEGNGPVDVYAEFGTTLINAILNTCSEAIQESFDHFTRKIESDAANAA